MMTGVATEMIHGVVISPEMTMTTGEAVATTVHAQDQEIGTVVNVSLVTSPPVIPVTSVTLQKVTMEE